MHDLDHVKDLLGHCAWADAMFFRAWAKADLEDGELRDRLRHSTATQTFFLQVFTGTMDLPWEQILRGEVKPPWADQPLPSFPELRRDALENHARFQAFAGGLDEARLLCSVTIPWFPEPPCIVKLGEALVQVAMHTQHHRGQAMTRLKLIGGKPHNVDYLIWLWKGRPEAKW
jgi:uncharacterized damage-inducible protein DinB